MVYIAEGFITQRFLKLNFSTKIFSSPLKTTLESHRYILLIDLFVKYSGVLAEYLTTRIICASIQMTFHANRSRFRFQIRQSNEKRRVSRNEVEKKI